MSLQKLKRMSLQKGEKTSLGTDEIILVTLNLLL